MRYFTLGIVFLFLFVHCNTQNGYKIKGQGDNVFNASNTTVHLYQILPSNILQEIDSTTMYSVSKFSITRNSDSIITPKIGLLLFDNDKDSMYTIIYLEQGYIYSWLRNDMLRCSNTLLNDKKNKLDSMFLLQRDKIQSVISQYLGNIDAYINIDSLKNAEAYREVVVLQTQWEEILMQELTENEENLLGQDKDLLVNYYKLQNIKLNANNIFGLVFLKDYFENFKGFEIDFALAPFSDSIQQENKNLFDSLSLMRH